MPEVIEARAIKINIPAERKINDNNNPSTNEQLFIILRDLSV